MEQQTLITEEEQQLRADAAAAVLGRISGMFLSDLQAQAGEIAVLRYRLAKTWGQDGKVQE